MKIIRKRKKREVVIKKKVTKIGLGFFQIQNIEWEMFLNGRLIHSICATGL